MLRLDRMSARWPWLVGTLALALAGCGTAPEGMRFTPGAGQNDSARAAQGQSASGAPAPVVRRIEMH